jgi:hypothetical protein
MGGQLVLIKLVLEAILVYWHPMAQIPKEYLPGSNNFVLITTGKACLDYKGLYLVSWKCLTKPKERIGWGLKDGVIFG